MIYEVRTYDLKPRSVPEFEKRFGEAYEKRKKYSELGAFWHTEIGPLNQVVHVWPYKDAAERDRIRAAAVKDGVWPPKTGEFVVSMRTDIMIPFAISPEMKPAKVGPYFEMRTYTYASGELPVIMKNWENAIEGRLKFGPVTAIWYSDVGALNKFVHIWPYKSLDERVTIRNKTRATGAWPPSELAEKQGGRGYQLLAQENKILMPSAFSPLQ
jgi:NIPSNAP protein